MEQVPKGRRESTSIVWLRGRKGARPYLTGRGER